MEVAGLSLAGPIVPPCFCSFSNPLFSPLGLANVKVHIVHIYASLPPTNACSYSVSATQLDWEGE
jgi:hypothetical protein